jgi:hypothetical protein
MKNTIRSIRNNGMYAAALLVAVGSAACGSSTTSEDVAYEDDYAGDYYYPADVAYAGVYAGGFAGYYAVTPAGTGPSELLTTTLRDGGIITVDAGHITIDAGRAGRSVRPSGMRRWAEGSVRGR